MERGRERERERERGRGREMERERERGREKERGRERKEKREITQLHNYHNTLLSSPHPCIVSGTSGSTISAFEVL